MISEAINMAKDLIFAKRMRMVKYHGVYYDGSKAELVLQPMLLTSKKLYLIFKKELVMITEAVYMAKDLIFAQKMKLDLVTNVTRKRSNPGYDHPTLTLSRKKNCLMTLSHYSFMLLSLLRGPTRMTSSITIAHWSPRELHGVMNM